MNLPEQYINDVVTGKRVAGQFEIKAVKRHLEDIDTAKERGLKFDKKRGLLHLELIKQFPFVKGRWGGKPFKPTPWQSFVIYMIYGWLKWDETDKRYYRRFKKLYIKIAKKNGKTEFMAAIASLEFLLNTDMEAEFYWGATKRDQAKIGWKRQKHMIEKKQVKSKYFKTRFGSNTTRIYDKKNSSFIAALGRDSKTEDGISPKVAIIDEYHEHRDNSLIKQIETASIIFRERLILIITTAGFNSQSECKKFEEVCKMMLNGTIENDELFALIFDLDPDDDWNDEKVWRKANPSLGTSLRLADFRGEYKKAIQEGLSAEINFKTKNLNIWTTVRKTWIQDKYWKDRIKEVSEEELKAAKCYGGFDLSGNRDFTAFALVFDLEECLYLKTYFYLPEEAIRDNSHRDGVNYMEWVNDGFLKLTPGEVIDYKYLEKEIEGICKNYDVDSIAYDPWKFEALRQSLEEVGIEMYPFNQRFSNFGMPTSEFERLLYDNGFTMYNDGNAILRWMLSNVAIRINPEGLMKPDKEKSKEKIDGIVAGIMALGLYMTKKHEKDNSKLPDDWEMVIL